MQCVVATLQPIPEAGHDVFLHVIKRAFGARPLAAAVDCCRLHSWLPGC